MHAYCHQGPGHECAGELSARVLTPGAGPRVCWGTECTRTDTMGRPGLKFQPLIYHILPSGRCRKAMLGVRPRVCWELSARVLKPGPSHKCAGELGARALTPGACPRLCWELSSRVLTPGPSHKCAGELGARELTQGARPRVCWGTECTRTDTRVQGTIVLGN